MKSNKFLVLLLILAICLSVCLTAVACKPNEPHTPAVMTQDSAMESVVGAVKKRFNFGESKTFGFSVDASAAGFGQDVGISLSGNIDGLTAANNQVGLEIAVGEGKLSLIADSEYLYAASGENKYRYTGVNFGDVVVGKVGGFADGFSIVELVLSLLNESVFDTYEVKDNTYSFSGKIDELIDLLGEATEDQQIVDAISTVLDGSILSLSVQIKDGVATDAVFSLEVAALGSSIQVSLNDIKFGTDYVAPIVVPSKDDLSYTTTPLVNFMLDGTFSLIYRNADYTTSSVLMNWDLVVYMNPFEVIRSIIEHGSIEGLFKAETTKFAFNVSHNCVGDKACSEFCKSKLGAGMGDFLSIAYAPSEFNDNNVKIAMDLAYLLPQGILDEATQGMLMNYINNKNYLSLSIDPSAIIKDTTTPQVDTVADNAISAISNLGFNPLALAANIFDLLKGISLTEDGLTLNAKAIYDLAEMFSTPSSNIANVLYKFLGGATMLNLKVNNYAYASEAMNDYEVKARFLQKSAADSATKNFALASYPEDPSYIPPEFICTDNAKVYVDEEGNNNYSFDAVFPSATPKLGYLTIEELEEVILVGGIRYTAKTLTGRDIDAYATIKSIVGLDREKFGVAQKVKIYVGDLSGTGISTIFSIVEGMLNVKLISGVFDATITLIRAEDIVESKFVMGDALTSGDFVIAPAFEAEKAYRFDEKFNHKGLYTVTFSYVLADGSNYTQTKEVTPVNASDYMSSSSVKVFGIDYSLRYKFYNEETVVNVKTYKYDYATEVKCKPGYSSALSGFDNDVAKKVNNTISLTSVRMFYKDATGADKFSNSSASKETSIVEMENMVVTKSSVGILNGFKFTAAGTYEVKGVICGVPFTATYIIT